MVFLNGRMVLVSKEAPSHAVPLSALKKKLEMLALSVNNSVENRNCDIITELESMSLF